MCGSTFRVLQLMNLTDSRLAQGGCEKLDLALLSFFEQFRKTYVGDQVQKTSKVEQWRNLLFIPSIPANISSNMNFQELCWLSVEFNRQVYQMKHFTSTE